MLIGFPPFFIQEVDINELDRLTINHRRFWNAFLETGTQIAAFALAFPEKFKKLKKPEIAACRMMKRIRDNYDFPRLLIEAGLGQERLIFKLNNLLEAKVTKFYQNKSLGEFPDNGTQFQAVKLLAEMHGLLKQVVEHQGTITFTEAIIQNYENRKLRLVGNDEHSDSGTS